MWGIAPSVILVLIPIVFVGIIVVAAIGSRDETTRGDKISRFFSIASNAAIFFTVLGLLYQVIDSEQDSRRASYSEVLNTYQEINQFQSDHPEVWSVIYPEEEESVGLSEIETLALQQTYFILNFFERVYLMFRDGVIDDYRWKAWENWIRYSFTTSALFQNEWDQSCGMYHPAFVDYIESSFDDGTCGGGSATPAAAPNR